MKVECRNDAKVWYKKTPTEVGVYLCCQVIGTVHVTSLLLLLILFLFGAKRLAFHSQFDTTLQTRHLYL
jgi:hypothetical protein